MPNFAVKYRVTGPITETTGEAENREKAVDLAIQAAPADSTVEVMNVTELKAETAPVQQSTKAKT